MRSLPSGGPGDPLFRLNSNGVLVEMFDVKTRERDRIRAKHQEQTVTLVRNGVEGLPDLEVRSIRLGRFPRHRLDVRALRCGRSGGPERFDHDQEIPAAVRRINRHKSTLPWCSGASRLHGSLGWGPLMDGCSSSRARQLPEIREQIHGQGRSLARLSADFGPSRILSASVDHKWYELG